MKLILSTCFCFIMQFAFSQTLKEAKDFIRQQLETHPTSPNYKQTALFADEGGEDIEYFVKSDYVKADYPHVIIVFEDFKFSGKPIYSKSSAFSVQGINNIVVTSKEIYTEIKIYLKDGYGNRYIKATEATKEIDSRSLNFVDIYIARDQDLGDRIAKCFYFMCKEFGGKPLEKSSF